MPLTLPDSVISSPPFGQDITFSLTPNVTVAGSVPTVDSANPDRDAEITWSPTSTPGGNDAARTSPKESAVAPTNTPTETMPSPTQDAATTPASIMSMSEKLTKSSHSSQLHDRDVTSSPTPTIFANDTPQTSPKTCTAVPTPSITISEDLPMPSKDCSKTPKKIPKTPPMRPILTRNASSFTRAKQALAEYTGRFLPTRSKETSPEAKQRHNYQEKITYFGRKKGSNSSSASTSAINSPEIQAMIKNDVLPDLELVNQALEAVNNSASDSEEEKLKCVGQLNAIAEQIEIAHRDARKVLTEAMKARDDDKKEICRGKCMNILKSPYAETATKVYAYNILSTQASPRQGERFLDRATELVNSQIKEVRERDHWLAVIKYLRGCLQEKAAAARAKSGVRVENREVAVLDDESEDGWIYHGPTRYRRSVHKALSSLRWREGPNPGVVEEPERLSKKDLIAKGAVTPRMEQILDWATEDMPGVRPAEESLCRCGDGDHTRLCSVHG